LWKGRDGQDNESDHVYDDGDHDGL
jgi:hypothetical protein